ncbi:MULTISPECIES: helix-turn-helix domain-containing protein [Bradyrhizobium]|uniref:helix-turn-helix domain-containing protein n=1 Tax=Bradyrhizobium elkanii TaxID=29448 RepID=UPI00271467EA|nr:helix-turn-helix transcriptional regulator [Bradyrhizobium elkanii]WLA44983.1 helix-turn-helix transcriptional regulator [Bradyrhizobium elkanii]WLB84888.1 helix-turn-helix transcriptional regulator [Bradyrhizobium elkanii]
MSDVIDFRRAEPRELSKSHPLAGRKQSAAHIAKRIAATVATKAREKALYPFDWIAAGRRLRVTRLALDISEERAAAGFGVSLRTYRGYEAGRPQRGNWFLGFAREYDVSLDWLLDGDTSGVRNHLAKCSTGRVAILPAKSSRYRSAATFGTP